MSEGKQVREEMFSAYNEVLDFEASHQMHCPVAGGGEGECSKCEEIGRIVDRIFTEWAEACDLHGWCPECGRTAKKGRYCKKCHGAGPQH